MGKECRLKRASGISSSLWCLFLSPGPPHRPSGTVCQEEALAEWRGTGGSEEEAPRSSSKESKAHGGKEDSKSRGTTQEKVWFVLNLPLDVCCTVLLECVWLMEIICSNCITWECESGKMAWVPSKDSFLLNTLPDFTSTLFDREWPELESHVWPYQWAFGRSFLKCHSWPL